MSKPSKKRKQQSNPDGVTIPLKSTTKKKRKAYCKKHSLFHGQKYKSCQVSVLKFKNGSTIEFAHREDVAAGTAYLTNIPLDKQKKYKNKRVKGYVGLQAHLALRRESVIGSPIEAPCACSVHLLNDAGKKDALHCLGHGDGCPCSIPKITDIKEGSESPADATKEER